MRIRTDDGLVRRIRHPLGRHARGDGAEPDARPAPARPRPGGARADLRRPQARAARLRPHGPRPPRHRALGPRRQEVRRAGRASCSAASARAFRPTPAPTTARTSRAASTAPRRSPTSPSLQGARLRRLQDPRLARRRPPARGRERARRARARRRRHGADARPGLRAAHLHGRALRRPRVRRGGLLLVRGPVSRRRGLRVRPQAPAREA